MELAGLTAELMTEFGIFAGFLIILIVVVAILYKNMLGLYAQSREDSLKREVELIKCFDNMSTTLKDINTTMKDTNIRLTIIEERSNNG